MCRRSKARTCSSPGVIAELPRVAVVQAAYHSRFGHPAPDVVVRCEARGVEVVRSDRCGARISGADGSAARERERARRYWQHRP